MVFTEYFHIECSLDVFGVCIIDFSDGVFSLFVGMFTG